MASSSSNGSQDELVLLEKVLMKLATADSDETLKSSVNKFLPPCLLKLNSPQEKVRKKVMELLVHINKRIKNNEAITLPVDTLLLQYQDPDATSFVTNFTIIYIQMGFPRLTPERQAELIPSVLQSLQGKPLPHQDKLLSMILPVLGQIKAPDNPEKKVNFLGLNEKPEVSKLLSNYLLSYLLLPYGSHPSMKPTDDPELAAEAAARLHPCLSEVDWKRVAGEKVAKAEDLERNKINIIKFLGMSLIPEKEIAIHLLVGTSDTRHGVVSQAETEMRKFNSVLDWEDPGTISQLYDLLLGTLLMKDKPAVRPELRRIPSNTRIRLKLVPYLLKSKQAALQFPACIQIIFDILFGTNGNSNPKLKLLAVTFIHHVIQHCPSQRLNTLGAVLLSALTKLVAEETENHKLRASCYVGIGKLGMKIPQLVTKDVTIIQTFFEAMSKEDKETQLSVQESMSMMAPSFRQMDRSNLGFVEALLTTYIENEESQVRLVAAQYAGEIFPSIHVASRYILLLGAGDLKDEVANVAKSHLYKSLAKYRQQNEFQLRKQKETKKLDKNEILPDFYAMLKHTLDKADTRVKTKSRFQVGDKVLAFNPKVYTEVLNFLRVCMLNSSDVVPLADSLEQPYYGAPEVTRYLKQLQTNGSEEQSNITRFVNFTDKLLSVSDGAPQAKTLLQVVGCTLDTSCKSYETRLAWLKTLLDHTRDDVRESVAEIFSLVVAGMELSGFERAMTDLTRSYKEKNLEMQHGLTMAIGYGYGRKILTHRLQPNSEKMNFEEWTSYKKDVEIVLSYLNHAQSILKIAACSALAELGRCGPLPLIAADKNDTLKSKLGVVKKLIQLLKNNKMPMKVREKAALAMGQMCIGDMDFPHRKFILEEFFSSAQEIKDLELHFTMGEALVYAALGPLSSMGRDFWAVTESDFRPLISEEKGSELIDFALDELCNKHTMSSHPNTKQASCIWLLALTKDGKNLSKVKVRLVEIQSAFMSLLGDSNDFVQDAASKGLGLVYDHSDESQQQEMVSTLLKTLTDGKREVQKVTKETKIFEEGQIGKAPTGENLSTYKELCSLATDLNQPDLVYKFMHLANYNAMWNSRKGAAFGFSSIAAKAGEQMEQHLPKIVPKLYRYQFDPTPKIQESMSSIWNCLIPETTKTVDKYLKEILQEINMNLTSNQWRVRESCCVALQDILRGRTLDDSLDLLPELWKNVFKVMDDIKESVRLAATKTASSLSRTCIKMCDINQGAKTSQITVTVMMPALLEEGLQSTVNEVRAISLQTIVKVTKNAGVQLKPHLPLLIPALLEAASEMESSDINYLSVRMANDPSIQEKLDLARIAAAKGSPMVDCVNYVLQYVDGDILSQLIPRLIDLIKGTVGIGTKGTAAHVIVTLTHQCPLDLQEFTGKILAAFVSGLTDRNAAVRKTYASAIGHLMKTAKDSSIEKLFVKLRTWYLEKPDEASKHAVAYTFDAINKHNPDRLKALASQAVPVAFLGMHEEKQPAGANNEILEIWEEVWSDSTPGTEGGIRLYLKEIMAILVVAIESQQWKMKSQVARAMGTLTKKLGDSIPTDEQEQLFIILLNSLSGRTWDGKDSILTALSDLCCSASPSIKTLLDKKDSNLNQEVLTSCLLRECKKENKEYRIAALNATGDISKALTLESFDQLFELLYPIIKVEEEKEGENKKNEDEDITDREEDSNMLEIRYAIYECLGKAWPLSAKLQEKYVITLLETLHARVQVTTRKNQLAIVKCLGHIMNTLDINNYKSQSLKEKIFVNVAKILSVVLVMPKSSSLRTESLTVLGRVIQLLVDYHNPDLVYVFRDEIAKSIDDVIKDVSSDPATKATAREIKASLHALAPMQEKSE